MMTTTPRIARAGRLQELRGAARDPLNVTLYPGVLTHVYIRLDMDSRYECATTSEDALSYLRAVAKSATISETIAQACNGTVLEVQGSTIHVGLPGDEYSMDGVTAFASAVHTGLRSGVEAVYSAVTGWRITADIGPTLVIPGRGVHDDLSFVSLGNAANRPATHLYAQLSLPEEKRQLKKYYLGVRSSRSGNWVHTPLIALTEEGNRQFKVAASVANESFEVRLAAPLGGPRGVMAMAAPIGEPGTYGAPTAERPGVYFGWVMRADLDGFTQRVEECHDQDQALVDLGREFVGIMDAAASFTASHEEFMVQLPWAGDNFTAAVVFGGKDAYDEARPKRLVEHALDFDDDLKDSVDLSGLNGWAFGVGGADVHGNAMGNVFIGSVELDGRRFLVGAGQGFARSLQAFADLKPGSEQMAVFVEDHAVLDAAYKAHFTAAKRTDGAISTLFTIADQQDLQIERLEPQTRNRTITISAPSGQTTTVSAKPYAYE